MTRRQKGFSPRAVVRAGAALVFLIWFQQSGYWTYRDLFAARIARADERASVSALEREVELLNGEVEEFLGSPEPALKKAREKLGLHPPSQIIIKVPGKR